MIEISVHLISKSFIRYISHWSSQGLATKALYSVSNEDLETINCFLDLHEISDLPRKKNWPETGL